MSYEVVLASGSIVTASASQNSELWRVLKGGCNNFGIVTRFTLRSMPAAPVWTSQTIIPAAFQHAKALKAYHDYLEHASSGRPGAFDEDAAGPIMTFVYIQKIGLQLISLNLLYTKAPEDKKWPAHWEQTGFTSLWSLYCSSHVESHTAAVERFGRTAPIGKRYEFSTTTIRNNLEAMTAAYAIFCEATAKLRHVRGLMFPFVFQSVLPGWMHKGHPNMLGLDGCTEPLIIMCCAVEWAKAEDDELVRSTVRDMLEQINVAAAARQADHPYRFMNYCMEWQRPYDGCGEENLNFMREISHKYDPDGLFQTGCVGGFKLDMVPR